MISLIPSGWCSFLYLTSSFSPFLLHYDSFPPWHTSFLCSHSVDIIVTSLIFISLTCLHMLSAFIKSFLWFQTSAQVLLSTQKLHWWPWWPSTTFNDFLLHSCDFSLQNGIYCTPTDLIHGLFWDCRCSLDRCCHSQVAHSTLHNISTQETRYFYMARALDAATSVCIVPFWCNVQSMMTMGIIRPSSSH